MRVAGERHRSATLQAFIAGGPVHRRAIAEHVSAAAEALPPGVRVLDAGAGNAPYREFFTHCDYRTQDWSASPHAGGRAADVISDLRDLPVEAGTVDFVLCTEVMEHLQDPAPALKELRRVLAPGGELLITVPFVMELHEEPHDFFRYTPHALVLMLEGAGFQDPVVEPLSGWWSTLAHLLFHCGGATRPIAGPPALSTRIVAFSMRQLSHLVARMAPLLDRLDRRRALPTGWISKARAPSGEA